MMIQKKVGWVHVSALIVLTVEFPHVHGFCCGDIIINPLEVANTTEWQQQTAERSVQNWSMNISLERNYSNALSYTNESFTVVTKSHC